jgi:hypothetical protein
MIELVIYLEISRLCLGADGVGGKDVEIQR